MYVEFCVEWFDLDGKLMDGMFFDTIEEAMKRWADMSEDPDVSEVTIERIEHKGVKE